MFAEISGKPKPAPLPGRINVGRLLRRCAGVNEKLLAWVPTERPRYTHMGGFVLFTALMAIGSSTIALMIAFDRPWHHVVGPALFWGVLIFNLDRWITASPLPEHGFRRFAVFLPRLLMALVFAIVIAEPVLLIVFKTAVTEQLDKTRADEAAEYKSLLEDCNPAWTAASTAAAQPVNGRSADDCKNERTSQANTIQDARTTKADAQKAVDDSAEQLTRANAQLTEATRQMTRECRGQDGSQYGNGPVCRLLTEANTTARGNLDKVVLADTAKRTALTEADKALAAAVASANTVRAGEITAMVAKRVEGQDDEGGLLERIEALNRVAADHLSLLLAVWAVRLLLIAVDSIPAIAKISSGTTTYDRLAYAEARLGAARHQARSQVKEDRARHWVDESAEKADLGRAKRRHGRDQAADALLLSAAQHRDRQASGFRQVVDEDQAPFGRATYSVAPRVEPAGPARRRPPIVETAMGQGPAGRVREDGARDGDGESRGERAKPSSISVVALGGPGSGKTSFLARMYAELRDSKPDRPFTLALSDTGQAMQLEKWAQTIRTPGDDWPDSTTTTHLMRYEFTCRVEEDGGQRPILTIHYWDYSGEALLHRTALPGIASLRRDLSEQIAEADALLVIVDGEELHKAWNGDGVARAGLEGTLAEVERLTEQAPCPAQIVVTKWDELENRRHPQGGVWNRAKVIQALSTLESVRSMGRRRTFRAGDFYGEKGMRVIPVSVVGRAGSTRRDGEQPIRLRADEPVNIDVPFVGLLPDRLDQIYAGKDSAAIERKLRLARSKLRWTWARRVFSVAGWVSGAIPFTGFAMAILGKAAETIMATWLPSYLSDKLKLTPEHTKEYRRQIDRAQELRASASRVDQARYRVMEAFSSRLIRFDKEYPPTDRAPQTAGFTGSS